MPQTWTKKKIDSQSLLDCGKIYRYTYIKEKQNVMTAWNYISNAFVVCGVECYISYCKGLNNKLMLTSKHSYYALYLCKYEIVLTIKQ